MEFTNKFMNKPIDPTIEDVYLKTIEVDFDNYPKNIKIPNLNQKVEKNPIDSTVFIKHCAGKIIKSCNKLDHGQFGLEDPKTKTRTWFEINNSFLFNNIEKYDVVVHEVIKANCKFFCDIDAKDLNLDRKTFFLCIREIRENFGPFFYFFFNLTNSEYAVNAFIAVSNAKYNSAHIVFDMIDKELMLSYIMKCPNQQAPFWISFAKYLNKKNNTQVYSKMIDLAIYRYNAQMRIIGSSSPKPENEPGYGIFRPVDGTFFRIIPKKIEDWTFRTKNDFETAIMNGIQFKDFLVAPEDVIYLGIMDYENEDSENKPIFYTEYEKLRFAEILKTSTKNINKYKSWRKAAYRIYCFYHYLPLEQRKQKVIEFFASRGWGLPKHTIENDDLCDNWFELKRHHNFSLETLENYFKVPELKWNDFEADEVTYPELKPSDKKIICMRSGTKTKKTYNFINQYKNQRTLSITYRVSLADEIVEDAKSQGLDFIHYKRATIDEENPPQHFVCQLESLYKYSAIIDFYDVIFIDESEALMGQFNHVMETNHAAVHVLMWIFDLIMNEKNVIFASANLGERTMSFIKNYKREYEAHRNIKKDKMGWSYIDIENAPAFMEQIKNLAQQGKKLIIPINEKTNMMTQIELILKEYGKVLIVTADEQEENKDVKKWIQYDFVIHTPTIEAGVNFLPEHFDHICGFFMNSKNNYDSCYQMLFRARNPKSKEIYLYAQPGMFLKANDLCDVNEIERRMQVQENQHKSFKDRIAFNDSNFIYYKYAHPVQKAMINQDLFRNYSKAKFKKLLIRELKSSGIICSAVVNESNFNMVKKNELTTMCNQKTINKIIAGEQGTTQELIFNLKEIEFPIEEKDFRAFLPSDPEKTEKITDTIKWVRNYYGLVNKGNIKKFNKEQDLMYKFLQVVPLNSFHESKELNELINKFFEVNYDFWTASCGKRKYSKDEIIKKPLESKKKILNAQLKKCFLKLHSGRKVTLMGVYNQGVLDKIDNFIQNKRSNISNLKDNEIT